MVELIKKENPEGSLVFENPEKAKQFAERVKENLENKNEAESGLEGKNELTEKRIKDAIREELESETSGAGPVASVEGKGEWQYSAEDRAGVQQYINIAFATTVQKAVEKIMLEIIMMAGGKVDKAAMYRKLDLFHDTLTDHLYQDMTARKMLPSG
ncbi:MAG: hypothetical protein Q7S57_03955 [bacterium]|nr:hypothetical protein [bacterium]